jgi:hypothetical protein
MEKVQAKEQAASKELQPVLATKAEPPKLPGYIYWDRRANGDIYGIYSKDCFESATRDGTRKSNYHSTEYIGKVIDKKEGIFSSKKRGIFKFTLENGYEEVAQPELYTLTVPHEASLRFGTTWVLDEYIKQYGLNKVLDSLPLEPAERDTLYSLLAFKTFAKDWPYRKAEFWFSGDYSNILYPKAVLYSQSIGLFLKKIGDEQIYRIFFRQYLNIVREFQANNYLNSFDEKFYPLLIDSTGLINSIETSITAPCSHGGPATDQVRLIYIVDHRSGLPIYFRYVPGNIVDKTTLIPTINILRSYDVDLKMLIMDAGYYSKDNIIDK